MNAPVRRLLVASTNPGKIREILHVLEGVPCEIATLADRPSVPEPEETGLTFAANAELKARYYAAATGWPTVAEDSGLAIDALDGRPGVTSARYPGATYADRFANLYQELSGHGRPWTARFVCALVVVSSDQAPGTGHWALASDQLPGTRHSALASIQDPLTGAKAERRAPNAERRTSNSWQVLFRCEAAIDGEIAPTPRGEHGFGYDPIFFYPPYGKTLGEATDEEKLAVSHRGQAFRILRRWLELGETQRRV
jgi:XTP/dITP diphosphohydrolase